MSTKEEKGSDTESKNRALVKVTREFESGALAPNEIRIVATKEVVDRYNTVISVEGLDIESYSKNPVVFYNHWSEDMPIGRAEVRKEGDALVGSIFFDEKDRWAMEICRKVKDKYINAVSIGFIPDPRSAEDEEDHIRYNRGELLEISVVGVPGNQESLVTSRSYSLNEVRDPAARALIQELMDKLEEKEEKRVINIKNTVESSEELA